MKRVNFADVNWSVVSFCPDCGYFYNPDKAEHFDVPYETMPADAAIELMTLRNGVLYRHPPMRGKRKGTKKRQDRGFGKQN